MRKPTVFGVVFVLLIGIFIIPGNVGASLIGPAVSFDNTDIKIGNNEWEVKTYQELWTLTTGNTNQYNGGYMQATSDGVNADVVWTKTSSTSLNLTGFTDLTITVDTDNGDASWTLVLRIGSDLTNYENYSVDLTNDVATSYILSDFTQNNNTGTPDMDEIDWFRISFEAIDTGLAGNVNCKVKDYKFITSVRTSDIYDSTGMAVIYGDDFGGNDGLNMSSYNSNYIVSVDGTSVAEIDNTEKVSGSTSMIIYRDGVNNPSFTWTGGTDYAGDYIRYSLWAKPENAGRLYISIRASTGTEICNARFKGGNIEYVHGNGAGGNNVLTAVTGYTIDEWYQFWYDIDLTNDKYRFWVDGILYIGTNADSGGWDNFHTDRTVDNCGQISMISDSGDYSFWIDDMYVYVGFEDFSALSLPHNPDEITESTTPTNTDYGRQTWDGDWTAPGSGSTIATCTTRVVGSNSIRVLITDYSHSGRYIFDTPANLTGSTHIRYYIKPASPVAAIRTYLYDGDGDYLYYTAAGLVPDSWNYLSISIAGMLGTDLDIDAVTTIHVMNRHAGSTDDDLWIDGFHLYGSEESGICFQQNSIDLNGCNVTQDLPIFDLDQIKDSTVGGDANWSVTQLNDTHDINVEFSDVAGSGIESTYNGTISIDGYANGTIVWTAEGDSAPTNYWSGNATGASILGNNFRFSYMTYLGFGNFTLIDGVISYAELYGIYGGNIDTNATIKATIFANNTISDIENATGVFWTLTNCTTDIINVSTGAVVVMLNSTFNHTGLGVNSTGVLIETNWSIATPTITEGLVSVVVTNTTYSNWTPTYNIYNTSGGQTVLWVYDWGDGESDSSENQDDSHTYESSGTYIVTLGSEDHLGDSNETTFEVTVVVSSTDPADQINALIPVIISMMSVIIVLAAVSMVFKPFRRIVK